MSIKFYVQIKVSYIQYNTFTHLGELSTHIIQYNIEQ